MHKKSPIHIPFRIKRLLGGVHPSWHLGEGEKFVDFKQYEAGDPVRKIDWKYAARTDQLMIRRYEASKTAKVLLLLDNSKSCTLPLDQGGRKEWVELCKLSLDLVCRNYQDRLITLAFAPEDLSSLPTSQSKISIEPVDVVLVVSDFFSEEFYDDEYLKTIQTNARCKEVRALALIRDMELNPENLDQNQIFVDPDSNDLTVLNSRHEVQALSTSVREHQAKIDQTFRNANCKIHWIKNDRIESGIRWLINPRSLL